MERRNLKYGDRRFVIDSCRIFGTEVYDEFKPINFAIFMKTLAIETSCDDTSIALVAYEEGIFVVEEMMTTDQLALHNQYG